MRALRLTGTVTHVVPTRTDTATGRRHGGFGFVRCDGVAEGALAEGDAAVVNVDYFLHARDTSLKRIEPYEGKRVTFTPTPAPAPGKKPGAIEAEAAE